jgi:outer membrane protein assembly factor BamD (BamD/ComL family)
MKLRVPLPTHQLLFALGIALSLVCHSRAQDIIIGQDGSQRAVKILGVSPSGSLEFQVGQGRLGISMATVKEVRMNPPAEYTQALAAYQAKDFAKALSLIKGVVAQFKGIPVPWAQQATAMLGELYIATNDIPKAEAAYADFKKLYPGGGSMQSEVGLSRLAVAKQDYETAKQKLAPIIDAALKEKVIPPANAVAYSQAFLVSGQVKEAAGDFPGALEDYLRTVTWFYHDRNAASSAQEHADALRSAHPSVTVP